MPLSREEHVAFWQSVARDLTRGGALIPSLEAVQQEHAGGELERVADAIVRAIRGGNPLSTAMADRPDAFSRCECAMVRAGEAAGTLDVVTERIVQGLNDRSLPSASSDGRAQDHPAHYWRALGGLLGCGVPLLEALRLVALEVAGPGLAEATQALRQAILDGRPLAPAMRGHREVFPEEVCLAVAAAERDGELAPQAQRIAEAIETESLPSLVPEAVSEAEERTREAVAFLARVIRAGVGRGASDIHLEPTADSRGRARLRLDGALQDIEPPPAGLFPEVVRQVKEHGGLDPAEPVPQDGRISLELGGRLVDLRVGVLPAVGGERVVLRVLDRSRMRQALESLEFLEDDLATVRDLCARPSGLVLCTGPMGSGKTTLLYAMLDAVDRAQRSVVTVEDPVEYRIEGATQVQVDPKRGLTAPAALANALRQDPDVLLVGLVREPEVAALCVQGALSGHLVLAGLNANSAPAAARRLLELGLEPFQVNAALAAVIAQRLVRVLCPECKEEAEAPLHSIPPEAVECVRKTGATTFWMPRGCAACHGTGYRGRTALHEILLPTERVRHTITAAADTESIRNAALAGGMRPLLACGVEKAARGITSLQEVCRVAPRSLSE